MLDLTFLGLLGFTFCAGVASLPKPGMSRMNKFRRKSLR